MVRNKEFSLTIVSIFQSRNKRNLILKGNENLNLMAENRSKKEVIWIDLLLHLDLSINKGTYNFYQKLFLSTSLTLFKIIQGNQLVEKQG